MDVNCLKRKKKYSTGKPLGRQGIKGIRESKELGNQRSRFIAGQYINLAFEHLSFVHIPPQRGGKVSVGW